MTARPPTRRRWIALGSASAVAAVVVAFLLLGRGAPPEQTQPPAAPEEAAAAPASAAIVPAPPPAPGSISGSVVSPEGAAIAGADVSVEASPATGDPPQALLTDAAGHFASGPIPAGIYTLRARLGSLISDQSAPISVQAGEDVTGIRLVVAAGGTLRATVRDATSGYTVDSCTILTGTQALTCDHAGRALIGPVAPGDLRLRVSSPGYSTQDLTVTIAQRAKASADIMLTRAGVITGVVLGPDHKPFAGAEVRTAHYSLEAAKPVEAQAVSGADGQFKLDGVGTGSVGVHATAQGYAEAIVPEFTLAAGEVHGGVELVLTTGGAIAGTVVTSAGAPAPGARVQAIRLADHAVAGTDIAATEGAFRFDGLTAGFYTVTAETPQAHGVTNGVTVPVRDEVTIRVVLGDDALDGLVHDTGGKPIAGATVTAYSSFAGGVGGQTATSGADGKFQIGGLVGAPFRVQARAEKKGTAEVRGIRAGAHVDLELSDVGKIKGTVSAPGGRSADNFDVKLVPRGSDHLASMAGRYRVVRVVSPDGAFKFDDVPAGSYTVTATAHGFTDGHASTDVAPGETSEVSLALGAGGSVSGHVLEEDVPMVGCSVGDGVSDQRGAYAVHGLEPGPQWITARCPDSSTGGATVTLADGDDQNVDIHVRAHGTGDPPPQKQEFGGIGAGLRPSGNGFVSIASIFEGGPAFQAGLQVGDVILSVDGASTSGANINAVVQQIRGPVGTPVVLSISRGGGSPFDAYVERDRIVVD